MLSFPTSVLWFSNTNWVSSESTQFWHYLELAQTLQVKGSFAQTAFTSDASSKSQEFWPNAYKPGESHNLLLRFQYSPERFTEFMKKLYLHFAAYYKGYISRTGSGKRYLGQRMGARALVWIFHALPRHATLSALQWLPLPRERSGGRWSWKFQHSDHGLILFVVVIQSLSHVHSLQPHRLQHSWLPCPSPSPRACSNSYPLHLPSCHLLSPSLLPSIFPSIRVFSSESTLCIRWPKHWSFSCNISPPNKYSGLISFRID